MRIEVHAGGKPVAAATVALNGLTLQTDAAGIVTAAITPGKISVRVTKEGYHPATAALSVEEPREYSLELELQPHVPSDPGSA